MDWELTSVGLPNTCSRCGDPCDEETGWYAKNLDAARAGGGVDEKCYVEMTGAVEVRNASEPENPHAETLEDQSDDVKKQDAHPTHRKRGKG
jgi:hypothetical protein